MGKEILDILKKSFPGRNIKLPSGIKFSLDGDCVTMTMLHPTSIGLDAGKQKAKNMQHVSAAFEAWAAILYAHVLKGEGTVRFSIPDDFAPMIQHEPLVGGNGHFSRFTYRLLRFSQQYDWFKLDKVACGMADKLQEVWSDQSCIFVNNFPQKEAGVKKSSLEACVEAAFADNNLGAPLLRSILGIVDTNAPVYRQLPAGLFLSDAKKQFALFTGGSSAVDLWTVGGSTLYPIELKAANIMVGAVTEIFFYSNYLYDMFVAPASNFQFSAEKGARGYSTLTARAALLNRVEGVILLDEDSLHPLVTEDVLKTLSQPKGRAITYRLAQYKIQPTLLPG